MPEAIADAVAALISGGVIAYPTEAVWGLGCDPHNEAACRRLLALKSRPQEMGMVLVAAEFAQLAPYLADVPDAALAEVQASWPGPNTWIFPRSRIVPPWIHGEHAGVAVRVSAHPLVRALCSAFAGALVSTSANRHGDTVAASSDEIRSMFGDGLDFVLEGELGGLHRPTSIRNVLDGQIVRR